MFYKVHVLHIVIHPGGDITTAAGSGHGPAVVAKAGGRGPKLNWVYMFM